MGALLEADTWFRPYKKNMFFGDLDKQSWEPYQAGETSSSSGPQWLAVSAGLAALFAGSALLILLKAGPEGPPVRSIQALAESLVFFHGAILLIGGLISEV